MHSLQPATVLTRHELPKSHARRLPKHNTFVVEFGSLLHVEALLSFELLPLLTRRFVIIIILRLWQLAFLIRSDLRFRLQVCSLLFAEGRL